MEPEILKLGIAEQHCIIYEAILHCIAGNRLLTLYTYISVLKCWLTCILTAICVCMRFIVLLKQDIYNAAITVADHCSIALNQEMCLSSICISQFQRCTLKVIYSL